MRKWISAVAAAGFIALLFVCVKNRSDRVGMDAGFQNPDPAGPSMPARGGGGESKDSKREAYAQVYKPSFPILQTGQGATTVLEIEHGLPEQRVDTEEMRRGVDFGLPCAITLRVVDSAGTPVSGAVVEGAFARNGLSLRSREFNIETDVNGEVALENKCSGDLNFSITKDGHYKTTLRYWFFKNGYNCVKGGRWQPWNPTVEVVLKEKRKPLIMVFKSVDLKLPLKNTKYGFDFLIGDLVAPEGKGEVADIWMKCWGDKPYPPSLNFSNELLFVSANTGSGFVRKTKDKWSGFLSEYSAPEFGYLEIFHLSTKRSEFKKIENVVLAETDYLVVKIVRDQDNINVIGTWYGKIHGPLIYGIMTNDREGAGVKFKYCLNPTPNDRNLEFEERHNF